jgi:hypothetical protein
METYHQKKSSYINPNLIGECVTRLIEYKLITKIQKKTI